MDRDRTRRGSGRVSRRRGRPSPVDRLRAGAVLLALRLRTQGDQRRGAPRARDRDAVAAAARARLSRLVRDGGSGGLRPHRSLDHGTAHRQRHRHRGTAVPVRLRGAPAALLDRGGAAVHRAEPAARLRRAFLRRELRRAAGGGLRAAVGGAGALCGGRVMARARGGTAQCAHLRVPERRGAYCLAREMYSPVRVSMRSTSPSLMKSGTRTTAPVSSFADFWPPVAVSPRSPGSVSITFNSMCGGGVTTSGTLFHSVTMHTTPSLSHCALSPTADLPAVYCSKFSGIMKCQKSPSW